LYPPLMMCYVLGFCTVLVLAVRRMLPYGAGVLMAILVMLLVAAHRAHIIGPEYLSHVLPFLTLPVGLFFVAICRVKPWPAVVVVVGCCLACALHRPIKALSGMDTASRQPRWSLAAEAIKARWHPGDRMLAGQYGTAGRWYLVYEAKVPADDRSVQILPIRATPAHPETMRDIIGGKYRFIVVGSSLQVYPDVNQEVALQLARWPVIWRSIERNGSPSRLIVYEYPARVVKKGLVKRSGRPQKESKNGRP
jgi:hypothetical protein